MADGSMHDLYIVPETAYGVFDTSSPSFEKIRHTGCSLGLTKSTHVSDESDGARQIRDFRHGVKQLGGDISFELSAGSFDTILEAVLGGAWTTNVLKAGTTRRSFTALRDFTDLDGGAQGRYHQFDGVEFESLNLTFPADGKVTGSFGILGQNALTPVEAVPGTTPTLGSANTNKIMDAFTATLNEGGGASAVVTEITLALVNGLAPRHVIGGSGNTLEPSIGRSNVTGQVTAYFEDDTLLNKFYDETESSLDILVSQDSKSYTFDMGSIIYGGGQPDSQAEGPITISLPFQAIYNAGDASNLMITRVP